MEKKNLKGGFLKQVNLFLRQSFFNWIKWFKRRKKLFLCNWIIVSEISILSGMSTVKKNGWIFSPASMNFLDEFFPHKKLLCWVPLSPHWQSWSDCLQSWKRIVKSLDLNLDVKTQSLVNVNVNRILYLIDS